MHIPEKHQLLMPYLILNGARKFLSFAQTLFDAELIFERLRDDGTTIMHAEMQIDASTIMFAEATADWPAQPTNLFIYVANSDEYYERALATGGTAVMEPSDQYGGRMSGVKDPTGNVWWMNSLK